MSTTPKPSLFVYVGRNIMLGAVHVATACNVTMARRIARALNLVKPGPKGY